jgi:hypothetical protein
VTASGSMIEAVSGAGAPGSNATVRAGDRDAARDHRLALCRAQARTAAGLIFGWYQHTVLSSAVRMRGTSFWTVMIFLMEASVFMLVGSSLRGVVEEMGGPIPLILPALNWGGTSTSRS